MNPKLTNLMNIAHLDVQFNYHELFGETAADVINRNPQEYGQHAAKMIKKNIIIRLQANLKGQQGEFVVYHYDLNKAITEISNQIHNG